MVVQSLAGVLIRASVKPGAMRGSPTTMQSIPVPTADLADQYGHRLRVCGVQFTTY
ncbi:hypothetical protein SUDANB146_01214 [Streptomyces sp. enrichment culture]